MNSSIRISSLVEDAERRIPAIVGKALNRGLEVQVANRDDLLEIRLDALPSPLIVAVARESRRSLVERAALEARNRAVELQGALPAVVAPQITATGKDVAEELGVGWFDLAGNAHLEAPGVLLHVEGKRGPARRRGRPASAFAPRGARVSRVLLVDPVRHWTQRELVEATGLAQGTVSRTLTRLRDLGLVVEDDERRYLAPHPGELLDVWRGDYDYYRHELVPVHVSGAGASLARDVVGELHAEGVDCALTGLPAAWLYHGFAQFRLVSVFVYDSPSHAAELLGARLDSIARVRRSDPSARRWGVLQGAGCRWRALRTPPAGISST